MGLLDSFKYVLKSIKPKGTPSTPVADLIKARYLSGLEVFMSRVIS